MSLAQVSDGMGLVADSFQPHWSHFTGVRVKTGHMQEKSQQLLFFFNLLFHKQQRNLALSQIVIYRQHLFLGIYFSHQRTIAAKCTYYCLEVYFLEYPLST